MTREEAIKLIEESDINDSIKSVWVRRITEEGLTQDVLDELKNAYQAEIDAGFERLGIDISDSPEYKQKEKEMVDGVEEVKAEFDQRMAKANQMMSALQTQTSETVDTLMVEEVKTNME